MLQEEALDLLKMGKNIFLTGAAGSGKTYLLNKYIRYLKDNNVHVAITASTGIAATHLYGTTLHSWSGIGIKEQLSTNDLEKLLKKKNITRNYKKTKVLIIDEISMLHKCQLDMVDTIARHILGNQQPFGGIQVVLCGDFFQLPPVSSSQTEKKEFAFEAAAWSNADIQVCYLHEQHRQGNDPLLTILNDIRNGRAGEHTKVPLRTRYKKEPHGATKATKLYARNINVDAINESELAKIDALERSFTMESTGFSALVEGLKRNCLAPEILKLKIGAEVMFIKNDPFGKYANGTRCIVTGFEDTKEAWPIVKTYYNKTITASPTDWVYEENGITRASITQIPLRLAWAITIHKSQGMTLDAAEMDLGDTFEPGMGYVALSRVRSLNGLKLLNLNEMALKVHPDILKQDQVFRESSEQFVDYLNHLSEAEKKAAHEKTLIIRFEGNPGQKVNPTAQKPVKQQAIPTHITTLEVLKENMSIQLTAEKRALSADTILRHIEKLKGLKQIDNAFLNKLQDKLPKNDFDLIYSELIQSEDGKLTPIFTKFEGKYSYRDIQLVRLFVD